MQRAISANLRLWKEEQSRKPLILKGARQVGKTYSLKAFGSDCFPRTHYLNFEENSAIAQFFDRDLRPVRILEELRFYLRTEIDPRQDLVIFDEIQRCPRALTSLKYFCEEQPELAICAAGSLLGISLNEESFPVGKVTFLEMWPMTFNEFLLGIGEKQLVECLEGFNGKDPFPDAAHDRLWNMWKTYLVVGGLPEAVNTYNLRNSDNYAAMQAVRKVQHDLENAYLADMAKHSGKTNALHIERLWKNIPVQLARAQDSSAPKFRFRDAIPGVRGYERLAGPLDWLEQAGLVHRISILDSVRIPLAGQAVENRFKLYFFDAGMLGAVSGLSLEAVMQYGFGSYQGYVAENFVAQEMKAAGCRTLYGWQGRTSEVEFLAETVDGIIPLEVKSGKVIHSKSLGVYEERYQPNYSVILSARNFNLSGKRLQIPLYAAGMVNGNQLKMSG
jgi:predicted AAA+ superfamily ATPase